MWLAVASQDLQTAQMVMNDQWTSQLTPVEQASADMVVDFDAEETTCPACMTAFAPTVRKCPGCGLRFG